MLMPEPGCTVEALLPGSAGEIETLIAAPPEPPRGIAVLCHPHPLFGGALSNKVVYSLASVVLKSGLVAARFNFRGVGKSAGAHDRGRGETDDVVTVVEALKTELPTGLPVLLGGFSFGAYVSLRAAARVMPAVQVSIAPPFYRFFDDAMPPAHPGCPWIAVHSTDDDTVSYEETRAVLERYEPKPELVTVEGAGHFFHGRLGELQSILLPFIERHWPAPEPSTAAAGP